MSAPAPSNLTRCDQEPIHIPGLIQPHGALLVLKADFDVAQCTENLEELLGIPARQALLKPLEDVIGGAAAGLIRESAAREEMVDNLIYLETVVIRERPFEVFLHSRSGNLILELENTSSEESPLSGRPYPLLRKMVGELQQRFSIDQLLSVAAKEIHDLTGFDRVLIYQFGPDWTGTVAAEARNENLPSYMDLRFPESDIPQQARNLYLVNRIRMIADANYTPVAIVPPVHPLTGAPPDLTYSTLRSVSPVHIEYMRNMGTLASMSISIIQDGRLWGLIACHHRTAKHVPIQTRFACELLAQVLSSQITAAAEHASNERRAMLQGAEHQLLAAMGEADSFLDAIRSRPSDMLNCVSAEGAAIVFENRCELIGRTPPEAQVRDLAAFLKEQPEREIFATCELSKVFPASAAYREDVSGMLAASISEYGTGYLLWFRPQKTSQVKWAGNPNKIEVSHDGRIHPRKSFQSWTELEQGRSQPWDPVEVESASAFRSAAVSLVLRKAQILASLSADLQRSNSELEAFSYSVSHDLRAPFRHIVGYAEMLREEGALTGENRRYLETILESAVFAGSLVDNLLSFSQIGRSKLNLAPVPLRPVMEESIRIVTAENPDRNISWKVGDLPDVMADIFLVRLAVTNLIRNAVKYTRTRQVAEIEIGFREEAADYVFFVRDNGVGFDMQYADKLFGVFQRLHRHEDFEGTGIGLATVRRIIERHGGKTWAEGHVDTGAIIYFSIPRTQGLDDDLQYQK